MAGDGRGNDSFVPRCIECGHPIEVHFRATRRDPHAGCNGTLSACDCPSYLDRENLEPPTRRSRFSAAFGSSGGINR